MAWASTARSPRLGPVDARALYPIAVWALHMREWTLFVALGGVVLFSLLSWRGYTPAVARRIVRRRLAGPVRHAVNQTRMRRWARWR